MRDKHIIPLLDSDRFGSLAGPELAQIEAHVIDCDGCRQAYTVAQAAAALLTARAGEMVEPAPFFATRVMATIRERQTAPSVFDWITVWRATRGFVLSTLSVVVLLAGLTFLTPQSGEPVTVFQQSNYSPEGIVFGDEVSRLDESFSNEQVMEVVFTAEDTDATNQK